MNQLPYLLPSVRALLLIRSSSGAVRGEGPRPHVHAQSGHSPGLVSSLAVNQALTSTAQRPEPLGCRLVPGYYFVVLVPAVPHIVLSDGDVGDATPRHENDEARKEYQEYRKELPQLLQPDSAAVIASGVPRRKRRPPLENHDRYRLEHGDLPEERWGGLGRNCRSLVQRRV